MDELVMEQPGQPIARTANSIKVNPETGLVEGFMWLAYDGLPRGHVEVHAESVEVLAAMWNEMQRFIIAERSKIQVARPGAKLNG